VPLDQLLAESDWVVPQLPGGPAAQGFIGRTQFAAMKPGACLVNISRADIVDRTALIEALKAGRLGGFALDPLYEAPGRSDDELLGFDNVVLSPHIAAQPRFNALDDLAEMMERLSKELAL
jgi:phosphoglycerate dehydrogenase-like enzyme